MAAPLPRDMTPVQRFVTELSFELRGEPLEILNLVLQVLDGDMSWEEVLDALVDIKDGDDIDTEIGHGAVRVLHAMYASGDRIPRELYSDLLRRVRSLWNLV